MKQLHHVKHQGEEEDQQSQRNHMRAKKGTYNTHVPLQGLNEPGGLLSAVEKENDMNTRFYVEVSREMEVRGQCVIKVPAYFFMEHVLCAY